jgi:putative component of membrane protein insertase Oxa1/YidC/SpoIIIJ protein YidD
MESTTTTTEYAKQIAPFFNAALRSGMNADDAVVEAIRCHGVTLNNIASAVCRHYAGRSTYATRALMEMVTDGLYEGLRAR